MKPRVAMVISMLAACVPSSVAIATELGGAVPVLWESPACGHDKLGTVTIEIGTRVSASTQDTRVPVVRVAPAFARLARAAVAEGGNAVVLRWHQGVYFTLNGRRSAAPVYITLRGAVIRLPDDRGPCQLVMVHADDVEQRMRDGTPAEATPRQAYSDD